MSMNYSILATTISNANKYEHLEDIMKVQAVMEPNHYYTASEISQLVNNTYEPIIEFTTQKVVSCLRDMLKASAVTRIEILTNKKVKSSFVNKQALFSLKAVN